MKLTLTLALSLTFSTVSMFAADDNRQAVPTLADVSYGPHKLNVIDFWKAEGDGPRPLLVYIHGGGWTVRLFFMKSASIPMILGRSVPVKM